MSININVRYSFSTGVSSLVLFRMATKISLRPENLLRDLAFSVSGIMLLPRDMSDTFHRSDTKLFHTMIGDCSAIYVDQLFSPINKQQRLNKG